MLKEKKPRTVELLYSKEQTRCQKV